jgi:hypothetical protein
MPLAPHRYRRFIEFTPAAEDDILVADNNPVKIEGYGTIKITLECEGTPDGKRPWLLYNVKYIPTFTTNTVSYNRFFDKQIYWDSENLCLKYIYPANSSRTPLPKAKWTMQQAHDRMGHTYAEGLKHLPDLAISPP